LPHGVLPARDGGRLGDRRGADLRALPEQRTGRVLPHQHGPERLADRVPLGPDARAVERARAAHVEELRHDAHLLARRPADGARRVLRGGGDGRRRGGAAPAADHPARAHPLRGDHHRAHREREPARLRAHPGAHRRRPLLLLRGGRGVHLPHRLRPRLRRRGAPPGLRLRRRLLLRRGDPRDRPAAGVGAQTRRRSESEDEEVTLSTPLAPSQAGAPSPDGPSELSSAPPKRRLRRSERIALVVGGLVLLPIALVWIYPFFWVITSSVKSNAEIFGSLNPFTSTLRLDNYVRAWHEANMGRYFLNTLFVTGMSILISVTVNALLGYVLGRYAFPGKKLLYAMLALVVFLPQGY